MTLYLHPVKWKSVTLCQILVRFILEKCFALRGFQARDECLFCLKHVLPHLQNIFKVSNKVNIKTYAFVYCKQNKKSYLKMNLHSLSVMESSKQFYDVFTNHLKKKKRQPDILNLIGISISCLQRIPTYINEIKTSNLTAQKSAVYLYFYCSIISTPKYLLTVSMHLCLIHIPFVLISING